MTAPLERLEALVESDVPEDFWDRADKNLAEGRVRLLLVADVIPPEARRIIEFLNDHMPLLEVAAVEVGHYTADGSAAFVPRVHGQTERAKQAKAARTGGRGKASVASICEGMDAETAGWVATLLRCTSRRGPGCSLGGTRRSGVAFR